MYGADLHSFDYSVALPICNSTATNYYVASGRMLESYDEICITQHLLATVRNRIIPCDVDLIPLPVNTH